MTRSGFPINYAGTDLGAAGYAPETDTFVVDWRATATACPGLSLQQCLAFITGHKSAHLWQACEGRLAPKHSNLFDHAKYIVDPLEIQAYEEGLAVANAVAIQPVFKWTFSNGRALLPPEPNPYVTLARMDVSAVADVRVHRDWTPLGVYRRVRNGLLAFFA